jgi:hypothetical protein
MLILLARPLLLADQSATAPGSTVEVQLSSIFHSTLRIL